MTVGELMTVLRIVPGDLEVRLADDSHEFQASDAFTDWPLHGDAQPIVYITQGDELGELPGGGAE